jgi:hypothetical protein
VKQLSWLLTATLAVASPGVAANCQQDTIDRIANAGEYLITGSGKYHQILGQDFIDPRRWRSGEKISVCIREPTDKDSDPFDYVRVYDIHNIRRNETLATILIQNKPDDLR